MRIVWAENPLNTRVELDGPDLKLLKEKLKSERLEDCLVSASFDLSSDALSRNKDKTAEERIAMAVQTLDADYLLDEAKRGGKTFSERLDESVVSYVQDLLDPHCGDCTCVAYSCSKCHAEGLLGVDTTKGLGKHPATKINAAFKEGGDIEGAIRWLSTYQPTHDPKSNWAHEEWAVHVPRWVEEGKRAHAWLVAYKAEHFSGGEE